MFMVEIAGMRALYTGDYSRLADRHMSAADLPSPPPHIGAGGCFCREASRLLHAFACCSLPCTCSVRTGASQGNIHTASRLLHALCVLFTALQLLGEK